jgi:hypothetical protein
MPADPAGGAQTARVRAFVPDQIWLKPCSWDGLSPGCWVSNPRKSWISQLVRGANKLSGAGRLFQSQSSAARYIPSCSWMVSVLVAWFASLPGRHSTSLPGHGCRMKLALLGTSCSANCQHQLSSSVTVRKAYWSPFLGIGQPPKSSAATSMSGRMYGAS